MSLLTTLIGVIAGDAQADRVVPPTGFTARLTVLSAAAMSFLAVFALALSLTAGRVANEWGDALSRSATVRISASAAEIEGVTQAALTVLRTTPGIQTARVLAPEEQAALLEPWLGPGLPMDALPVPRLIEVIEAPKGYAPEGLRLRLSAEAPGAVLDDHARWRKPLVSAASRLRGLGWTSLLLIGGAMAAMITLAAQAALAANAQVIAVLRLVGARDAYIAGAFMRRFTKRAFGGALLGTVLGMVAVALLPNSDVGGAFLPGLGFHGAGWLTPMLVPFLAAGVAWVATRSAALRSLRELA